MECEEGLNVETSGESESHLYGSPKVHYNGKSKLILNHLVINVEHLKFHILEKCLFDLYKAYTLVMFHFFTVNICFIH